MTKLSLRAAINAHCRNCIYDPGNGNGAWKEQVSRCTSTNCALWPVRPQSGGERIRKAVSSPENAQSDPAPANSPEADVSPRRGSETPREGQLL